MATTAWVNRSPQLVIPTAVEGPAVCPFHAIILARWKSKRLD
jgi:hypothetical protein